MKTWEWWIVWRTQITDRRRMKRLFFMSIWLAMMEELGDNQLIHGCFMMLSVNSEKTMWKTISRSIIKFVNSRSSISSSPSIFFLWNSFFHKNWMEKKLVCLFYYIFFLSFIVQWNLQNSSVFLWYFFHSN